MTQTVDIRIPPEEARAMVEAGEAIVLDVVAPHVWPGMRRAIRGAVRLDPSAIAYRYAELPRERAIIAYCT